MIQVIGRRVVLLSMWVIIGAMIACNSTPPTHPPSHHLDWQAKLERGFSAHQAGQHHKAQKIYQAILQETEPIGANEVMVATTLVHLGNLYRDQGRYHEAEELYLRSLEIYERVVGSDSRCVATNLDSLAMLHFQQRHYDESEAYYRRALTTYAKVDDNRGLFSANFGLAFVYHYGQNRPGEAEQFYSRALEIAESEFGAESQAVVSVLLNYARLLAGTKRDLESQAMQSRGEKILSKLDRS